MESSNNRLNKKTLAIVQIAIMSAIIYLATAIINIPVGIGYKGVAHLGDTMIFVSAIFLGRKKGVLASAIGMSMFDLFSPYIMWVPFTFLIKGSMAYIASAIACRKDYNGNSILNNLFAFVIAGIWMNFAYFIAGGFLNHFYMRIPLYQGFLIQATHIPADIIQVFLGIIIALPLIKILKKAKFKIC